MSRTLTSRLVGLLLVSCSPAFAEQSSTADGADDSEVDGEQVGAERSTGASSSGSESSTVESAQDDIQRDAQRLGKSAGVKPEVLEGRGGYGSAGCGLGSVIVKPSEHFTQIFAATTNGLFGNQTFGITSGTSNCDGPARPLRAAERFVIANRSALAIAAARGRGETIDGLSALASCRDSDALGLVLQKNFRHIFPNAAASDLQVTRALWAVVQQHASDLACSGMDG